MKPLIICSSALLFLSALFSCAGGNAAELNSIRLCFSSGMTNVPGDRYEASLSEDGKTVIIRISVNGEERIICAEPSFLSDMDKIVKQYKMRRYKAEYRSMVKVNDAGRWALQMEFSDGTGVSSSGSAAWPRQGREALRAVRELFENLEKPQAGSAGGME